MDINFKKNINLSIYMYIGAYLMYIFSYIVGSANFTVSQSLAFLRISNVIDTICKGLLIASFLLAPKLTNRKIAFVLISIPIILFTAVKSGSTFIMIFLFVIAYPASLSTNKLAKYACRMVLISVLVVIFLMLFGVVQNYSADRGNGVIRNSLGFITPNTFGNYVLLAVFLKSCAIGNKKWKIRNIILWIIIIFVTYEFCNSRASFNLSILLIFILFIKQRNILSPRIVRVAYKLPIILFSMNAAISIFSMIYFSKVNSSFKESLNELLSNRIIYFTTFYKNYGLSLFGNKNVEIVSFSQVKASNGALNWMGIDNSYIYMAIVSGIVVLISFGVIYYFAQKKVFLDKDFNTLMYLIFFTILGLTENYMRLLVFNYSIIIFAAYLVQPQEMIKYKGTKVK